MGTAGKAMVRVAAIQARSLPGQTEANLKHAGQLTEQAVAKGARLVVLPELFSCGYIPNRGVWDVAEPRGGPTEQWLAATARHLGN